MNGPNSRLDAAMNRLRDIPGDVADGADDVFQAASGELLIRDDDAPDRESFEESGEGYRRYLNECHTWASVQYQEFLEALGDTSEVLALEMEDYPEFGNFSQEATNRRDRESDGADALVELFDEAAEARETMKLIEAEIEG